MKSKHSKLKKDNNQNTIEEKKNIKNKKIKNIILSILQLVFLGLMVYSGINIYLWWEDNKNNENQIQEIKDYATQPAENEEEKYVLDFVKLKEKNPDTVGWIKVEGTNIDYPVVKTKDNDFYINHSFDKSENGAGWIFVDYRNKLDGKDKNIIIYGHNRRNGTMFEGLKSTLKPEWYDNEENRIITYTTETQEIKYEVFSTYQIEVEDYYTETEFNNKTFETFLKTIKGRSVKDYGVEVKKNDTILTLSTCGDTNNHRIVLHAKKIL